MSSKPAIALLRKRFFFFYKLMAHQKRGHDKEGIDRSSKIDVKRYDLCKDLAQDRHEWKNTLHVPLASNIVHR